MIKLALSDLDNTLMPAGAPCASRRTIAAIHHMLNAGLHFGPVTGRVPAAMRWMFAGDEACGRTGAYVNGQMVYVDGQLVHEETLDVEVLDELGNMLHDHPGFALSVYDLDDISDASDGVAYHLGAHAAELALHPEIYSTDPRPIEHLRWNRCVKANVRCAATQEQMVEMRDLLRERFPQFDYVFPAANGIFIDILPLGWSKGKSVEVLAEHLGIGLDEIAAFGDSENDLSMLRAVTHSVAVANATAEVKAASHWHIGACANDAVADALADIADAAATGAMPSFMR